MSGASYEREIKEKLENAGTLVFRAAGSHGHDLLAVRPWGKGSYVFEVKSTGKDPLRLGKRSQEQFKESILLSRRGFDVYWVVRYKGGDRQGKTRVFPVTDYYHEDDGMIPKSLRREDGIPFEEFVATWT